MYSVIWSTVFFKTTGTRINDDKKSEILYNNFFTIQNNNIRVNFSLFKGDVINNAHIGNGMWQFT